MNRVLKFAVASAAISATVLTTLVPADAHGRWRHREGGAIMAAGLVGLALGAIAAGVLSEPEPIYRPVHDERDPVARPKPMRPYLAEPIHYQSLEPWSPAWYRYCEETYHGFDPETGTYVGEDGRQHFCVAG